MEMTWLITAILGFIVLYLIRWLATVNNNYWKRRGIPYIKSPPLLGSLVDLVFMRKGYESILLDIYKKFEGEKFVGFFQFTHPTLMIRDPELINQVLIKDFTYFEDRQHPSNAEKDLFTNNISSFSGDNWRYARHKLTPTFTSGKMKTMFKPIKECSEELVYYLQDKKNTDVDVKEIIQKVIYDIIGNIAFGLKLDVLNGKDEQSNQFYKHSSAFFKPSTWVLIKTIIYLSSPKIKDIFKIKIVNEDIETFFKRITTEMIKYREETNIKKNDFLQFMLDLKKKEKESLQDKISDLYLHNNEPIDSEDKELMDQLKNTPAVINHNAEKYEIFTDDFIAAQAFLFISAGSETTASVVSFVLYELAANQDLQRKVQDEIDSVLSSQEFNYQAIKKMTYLEQFINETFRLHPIAVGLFRYCNKDYKIPGTDLIIEKGMSVNIPVVGLHKDPQYFPDPEKFNPDRFQDMNLVPKGVYLPFGGGPRICIAMRLAMLEMKIILATLLSSYNVILSKKMKLPLKRKKVSLSIEVEGGIWVMFQKREN